MTTTQTSAVEVYEKTEPVVGIGNGYGSDGTHIYHDAQQVATVISDPVNGIPSLMWADAAHYDPAVLDLWLASR